MPGYVYRYTHVETGMWYIGSHNGKKKNYTGSGLVWSKIKKKHGLDSFTRDILYEGDDFRKQEEIILVELDAANDPMSYNLKNQALGGAFFGKNNGMYGRKLSVEERYKCGSAFRGKSRPEHSERMSGSNNPMYGKDHHTNGLKRRAEANIGKTFNDIFGEERSIEIRTKLSKASSGKKKTWKEVTCPHCGKTGRGPNMTRYHFDACKKMKR